MDKKTSSEDIESGRHKGSFNNPHPNSLMAKYMTNKKMRARMKEFLYEARLDSQTMEEWYRGIKKGY